jgi:hypothetical protein
MRPRAQPSVALPVESLEGRASRFFCGGKPKSSRYRRTATWGPASRVRGTAGGARMSSKHGPARGYSTGRCPCSLATAHLGQERQGGMSPFRRRAATVNARSLAPTAVALSTPGWSFITWCRTPTAARRTHPTCSFVAARTIATRESRCSDHGWCANHRSAIRPTQLGPDPVECSSLSACYDRWDLHAF